MCVCAFTFRAENVSICLNVHMCEGGLQRHVCIYKILYMCIACLVRDFIKIC